MQTVPAEALRGKAIRLRGQVRATTGDATGGAALWLRVDRANQVMGFFDNMGNRLVREREWRLYAIEGTVADDAEAVAFGVMAVGGVTADFDAVELAAKDATGDWTPVPVKDPGFEAAAGDEKGPWFRTGTSKATVSRPADGAPEGGQYLLLPSAGRSRRRGALPGRRPDSGGARRPRPGDGPPSPRAARPDRRPGSPGPGPPGRARRAARGALEQWAARARRPTSTSGSPTWSVAWSVFRHFYPYWTEAGVDWDSRLRRSSRPRDAAETRAAQRDALKGLVADVRDGHGFVADTLDKGERGELPVALAVVEGRLVVTSSGVPSEVPVGAVVVTLDGVAAADRLARATSLASGSTQWRQVAATWPLMSGAKGATAKLGIDIGSGPREVTLTYGAPPPPPKRPGPVAELEPGVWYVDLTRAKMAEVAPKLEDAGRRPAASCSTCAATRPTPASASSRTCWPRPRPTAGCTWRRSSGPSTRPRAGWTSAGT